MLNFKNDTDFKQAAFDIVALVVGKYGQELLVSGVATPATELCLEHLNRVASTWGFDSSKIAALHSLFQEENDRLSEIEANNHD